MGIPRADDERIPLDILTFPYTPRKFQADIINEITSVLTGGEHLIMESGTGTGKTISTLAPAVDFALKNGKRVLYLTRTNAQQTQVILELREIMNRLRTMEFDLEPGTIPGIGLQGRRNMCCMVGIDPEFEGCTSEELSRLCNRMKRVSRGTGLTSTKPAVIHHRHQEQQAKRERRTEIGGGGGEQQADMAGSGTKQQVEIVESWRKGQAEMAGSATKRQVEIEGSGGKNQAEMAGSGTKQQAEMVRSGRRGMDAGGKAKTDKICPFYTATLAADLQGIAEEIRNEIPTAEELIPRMKDQGLCPYELIKVMLDKSLVVTAPYIYLFDSGLRGHFLDWMGASLEDLIVVVDEAHNLPNYARELVSSELSTLSLNRAASEAKEFGTDGPLKILKDLTIPEFAGKLQEIIAGLEEDYVLEEDGLVPPYELEEELMHGFGLTSNKLRMAVGELINHGLAIQDERLKKGRLPRSYIHAMGHFMLWWMEMESTRFIKLIRGGENPTLELYCMDPSEVIRVVKSCHSSIHISGTLRPLAEYLISSGLPRDTRQRIYPSPFPPENRVVLFMTGVTSRYEDLTVEMVHRLMDHTLSVCNGIHRSIMVFFPSFKLLTTFLDSGFTFSLDRPLHIEEQGLSQADIMARVQEFRARGGVFFSVIGGRLSEGMDFPEEVLEIVILEGIPYPKPTARQRALKHYYEVRFGKGWEYTVKAPTTRKVMQSIGRLIRTERDRGVAVILDKRAIHFREDIPDLRESEDLVKDINAFFG